MVVFHFKSATNQNQNQSILWWLIHHSAFLQIACLCFSWEHCTLCLIAPHIANAQPLIHNWPNKKCCNSQIIVSVAKQLCIQSNCKTAIVRIGNNTKGFNPIQHCPGFATIIFLEASQWILNQIAEPQKQGHKARQMRVKLDRNCCAWGLSYRQHCRLSICWYFDWVWHVSDGKVWYCQTRSLSTSFRNPHFAASALALCLGATVADNKSNKFARVCCALFNTFSLQLCI